MTCGENTSVIFFTASLCITLSQTIEGVSNPKSLALIQQQQIASEEHRKRYGGF